MPAAMTSMDNPSLGMLSRLPGELRNGIYQLVINNNEHELEVDFHKPCRRPRQSLHLVSRCVNAETKSLMAAAAAAARARPWSCQHVNYTVTLPTPDGMMPIGMGRHLLSFMSSPSRLHAPRDLDQAKTIRFVTGHLGGQAPSAVTCSVALPPTIEPDPVYGYWTLPPPESTCEVFGADGPRTALIERDIPELLAKVGWFAMNRNWNHGLTTMASSVVADRIRAVSTQKKVDKCTDIR